MNYEYIHQPLQDHDKKKTGHSVRSAILDDELYPSGGILNINYVHQSAIDMFHLNRQVKLSININHLVRTKININYETSTISITSVIIIQPASNPHLPTPSVEDRGQTEKAPSWRGWDWMGSDRFIWVNYSINTI